MGDLLQGYSKIECSTIIPADHLLDRHEFVHHTPRPSCYARSLLGVVEDQGINRGRCQELTLRYLPRKDLTRENED